MKDSKNSLEQKLIVEVSMEGQRAQILELSEEADIEALLNYDTICKKILQTYRFTVSTKSNIFLHLNNFYGKQTSAQIPIFNPKNWSTLIANMLEREIYHINVSVIARGELRQRKKRMNENPVEFDSDGSIQSAQDCIIKEVLEKNKPSNQPYQEEQTVRCHFCHKSNKEDKARREAGPFYGPFRDNLFAHLLCLLWCSCIFLDEKGFLSNVEAGIKTASSMQCHYCKLKGASFKCHSHSCKLIAHYRCATLNNWYFNWSNFTVYCPEQTNELLYRESLSGGTTRTLTQRQSKVIDRKMEIQNARVTKQE